jgi:hypothetical protein
LIATRDIAALVRLERRALGGKRNCLLQRRKYAACPRVEHRVAVPSYVLCTLLSSPHCDPTVPLFAGKNPQLGALDCRFMDVGGPTVVASFTIASHALMGIDYVIRRQVGSTLLMYGVAKPIPPQPVTQGARTAPCLPGRVATPARAELRDGAEQSDLQGSGAPRGSDEHRAWAQLER